MNIWNITLALFSLSIFRVVFSISNSTIIEDEVHKLILVNTTSFFNSNTGQLNKYDRLLLRVFNISREIKRILKEETLISKDFFTMKNDKHCIGRFKCKSKGKVENIPEPHPIRVFCFKDYPLLSRNPKFQKIDQNKLKLDIDKNETLKYDINEDTNKYINNIDGNLTVTYKYSNSSLTGLMAHRRPKYIILALLGISSDKMYYEAFRYTYDPFISNMRMYGRSFANNVAILFPHEYIRRFKILGFLRNIYRFAWADFGHNLRLRSVNSVQWIYSVKAILNLIYFLIEKENYNPKNIFLYGYSQGAALALSTVIRSKYKLGGCIASGGMFVERTSAKIRNSSLGINKKGLSTSILIAHCNPDIIFPFRNAKKDFNYLKNTMKANTKKLILLGYGHSCMSKYAMVYINWFYSIISSYKGNNYKERPFNYDFLDLNYKDNLMLEDI
ncbi:phospholipase carboxylesterase family protein [Cryptosporidium andersoni]|uniref:Phospholipase carboxylesterase family protein n=1 Tax=Cryptosporidium andersoni TaxID=117008 RepID=A0A1J4MUR2_9CRYT|nr:phospholipase carboxylesterase family protein [Cryptosporidium andersoni]